LGDIPEDLPDDRDWRGAGGRHLDDRAPQPRRRLRVTHEPLASPLRFKPTAAVLLIELVQQTPVLCAHAMPASIFATAAVTYERLLHPEPRPRRCKRSTNRTSGT
jgi:hypothetical protein